MVLINLTDMLELLNRMGVRVVNDMTAHAARNVTSAIGPGCMGVRIDIGAPLADIEMTTLTAPISLFALPPGCFHVPSLNYSMYGRKMCDVNIVNAWIHSDAVIRFRARDNKVLLGDLLVVFGRYKSFKYANRSMKQMIDQQNGKVSGLESIEVDSTLNETKSDIVVIHLQDVAEFFNRIGVCAANNALFDRFRRMQYGVGTSQPIVINLANLIQPSHRAEMIVREAINSAFEGFIHNKVIRDRFNQHMGFDDYHRLKIDHRLHIGNTILAVETDEDAHVNYKYENERYHEFMKTFSYKFVFIRFNPGSNMEDPSAPTDFPHKLRTLMLAIMTQIKRIQSGENVCKIEILRLFYATSPQFYAINS